MTEPQVRELPACTYVGERSTVAMDQLAATIDAGFPRLFARAGEPLGAPFIRYHAFDPQLDIELGVPSAAGEAEFASGEFVMATHVGAYEELVGVHAALQAWLAERGLSSADAIELYQTDPRAEPDVSKWVTEVGYRLVRARP